MMTKGVSNAPPRRSARLLKRLQEQRLNAAAIPSPVVAGLPQDADEIDQSPTKKAGLTNTQRPEVEGEGAQPADKHPKPNPPYASFPEKFVGPFQPSPRANSEHSLILKWLESVGSDRDSRSRSGSRSAPVISSTRDTNGSTVPPMSASAVLVSRSTRSSSGPQRESLVESPQYRRLTLASNNIHMRPPNQEFPEDIASLINNIRKDRDSPGPSLEDVRQDSDLAALSWMGAEESQVESYFRINVFPFMHSTDILQCSYKQPMAKYTVPSTWSGPKVSNPVPDILYGYQEENGFPQHLTQLRSMGTEPMANSPGLLYPFLVVEFTGDGPSGTGSLWVATNQCLGGSASCVNIAETLNRRLTWECKSDTVHPINSAAFSIAMSGTEARLYISWKQSELDYYMANVDVFTLQKPQDYIKFRKYVRNILDWGKGRRLEEIRKSLDILLEETPKRKRKRKSSDEE